VISLPEVAPRVLAIGWATVELDRAAEELAHLLAPGAGFGAAASSVLLRARCRSAPAAGAGLWIVLLEPDTEGRLAASLARSGEGWTATWTLAAPSGSGSGALSAARPGPFGPERLRLGGGLAGPHRLVVEAVPSPP
jgi:hypothetical protein